MNNNRILEFPFEFITYVSLSLSILLLATLGCGGKKRVEYGPQNTEFASSSKPESLKLSPSLSSGLESSLEQNLNWNLAVDRELRRLSEYINGSVREKEARSKFTATELVYAGMDRADADQTHSGDVIEVKRWRRGSKTANFLDNGLEKLVENLYEPWESPVTFQTKLIAHQISRDQDMLNVTVVAKTLGQLDDDNKLESTSLWTTQWKIRSSGTNQIDLVKVQVDANEETRISGVGSSLFKNATADILRKQDCLPKQLNHSLDDWAKSIAGIDIMGNNGIAIGDPNNDGLEDIYLCQPHGLPNLMLFQNMAGTATNVGVQSGTNLLDDSRAALFVDLDNDGDEDLVISTSRELILMSNSGKGAFQLEHRLIDGFNGGSISSADYDNDGDLDLFICKRRSPQTVNDIFLTPNSFNDVTNGGRNILLQNNGGWRFEDVTYSTGLELQNNRFTRCAIWCDFDSDGDQDLFVVNEYSKNQLWENTNGQFSQVQEIEALNGSSSARSASLGDFNADGKFDFFVASNGLREARQLDREITSDKTDFQNALINSLSGESHVYQSSLQTGKNFTLYRLPGTVFNAGLTNSTTCIDINNDGFEDVLLTNGLVSKDVDVPDRTLESHWLQQAFTGQAFSKTSARSEEDRFASITRVLADEIRRGESFGDQQRDTCLLGLGAKGFANFSSITGMDVTDDARAIATLDWDLDGDLDVVVNARTAPRLRILLNQLESKNQFVSFHLKGVQSNRDAVGAKVEIYLRQRNTPIIKTVTAGSGTISQSSKRLHFGIPNGTKISKMVVHWPSGLSQTFSDVIPDTHYQITEGDDRIVRLPRRRFRLRLGDDSQLVSEEVLEFDRSVFHPPHGLPALDFQGESQAWFKLKNMERMPLFVMFVDGSNESTLLLKEFVRESREFSSIEVDVVAIRIDGSDPDSVAHFEAMQRTVNETEFPFRYGAASKSMIDKLERLHGEWFSRQEMPQAPFGLLIDGDGLVRVSYRSGNINPNQIINDVTLVESGTKQTAKQASPFRGVWLCSPLTQNYGRLAKRFDELGYADDHDTFQRLNRSHLATQECQLANILVAKREFESARATFKKALELEPECGLTCLTYGRFLLRQFQNEPSSEARRLLLNEAESIFDRALRLEPSSPQAVIGRANVDKNRDRVDEAITLLEKHLKINTSQWEVHAALGRLLYEKRQYIEATTHLRTAFKERPTLPFVAGDLGFLHLHGGLFKEARYYLKAACQLQPESIKLRQHLAHVEYLTEHYEASIGLLRDINELESGNQMAMALLAWQLATCPDGSLRNGEESVGIALDLVKNNPQTASCHEICAAAYAETGDFEKALTTQRKANDLVQTGATTVTYSNAQEQGLQSRLQLYQQQQPCRSRADDDIPIRQPGT